MAAKRQGQGQKKAQGAPEGYVEVPDRIIKLFERHPDASLQGEYEYKEVNGETVIIYTARAYRTADDERPGVGTASEPVPGKTPYTRGSELMNAETSAWGRALVALGFIAQGEKIATAQEVRAAEDRARAHEEAQASKRSSPEPVAAQPKPQGGAPKPVSEPEGGAKPAMAGKLSLDDQVVAELRQLAIEAGLDATMIRWALVAAGVEEDTANGELADAIRAMTPEQAESFRGHLESTKAANAEGKQ